MYDGYRDLKVYRLAYDLCLEIFEITKSFPREEKYSLIDQMRRSSRSIPANIAEAWEKRYYKKMFIHQVITAFGEAGETEFWLDLSKDCQYLDLEIYKILYKKYEQVNMMLDGMIKKADRFCLDKK